MVLYHGTGADFNEFKGGQRNGYWLTLNQKSALSYVAKRANNDSENYVMPLLIDIRNSSSKQYIDPTNPISDVWTDNTKRFNELGYDGWISRNNDNTITKKNLKLYFGSIDQFDWKRKYRKRLCIKYNKRF